MVKRRITIIIIATVVLFGILILLNIGRIIQFVQNKEWEIADSVASVQINNFILAESTLNDIYIVSTNHIKGYSTEGKEKLDIFIPFQEIVSSSAGDFFVVGEKNGSNIYLISASKKLWDTQMNGSINDVYVNKNGYVAVIYKQSGYKSLIKVLSPSGGELFTSYLASTYAVDVAITSDNKTLAIAEIDTEGIHVVSAIKLIDINNLGNERIQKVPLEDNTMVVDIEYNDKNELLVRTDSDIEILRGTQRNKICSFDYSDTIYATIENQNQAILVKKEENGLFDVKYQLLICMADLAETIKEYELYDIPKKIIAKGDIIAVVMDKEVLFVNTNAKLTKKVNVNSNVKDIKFFSDNDMIGIVFRNVMELVEI